jgi:hypothetical protein
MPWMEGQSWQKSHLQELMGTEALSGAEKQCAKHHLESPDGAVYPGAR